MRKCATCGHPKENHGKGMLGRIGFCLGIREVETAPCSCPGFADPFLKMTNKEKIRAVIGEQKEIITGVFRQKLEEEEIEISDSELAKVIFELFDEEKISISSIPY